MPLPNINPTQTASWQKLNAIFEDQKDDNMLNYFNADENRVEKFSVQFEDLLLDYSKNRLSERALKHLLKLAEDCDLKKAIKAQFEGEIINKLHEVGFNYDGIILNAGAYTHTSVAIGDAVKAIETPVIEVHISNIHNREDFRHVSFIAPHTKGIIAGFGLQSYELALESFV